MTINDAPGKTYDGKPVSAPGFTINFGSGSVTIEYKLQSEPDSAYTETAPTDAGNYTVRVTLPESKNFTEASDTKDFTISKATDNTWLTKPSIASPFYYGDTNPVTYSAKYGNANVVVTYKKQGTQDTPSATVPTAAGTYDVTVSLAETNNYSPKLEATNLTLTISPRSIAKPSADTTAFTYTGEPQTYTLYESEWYTITGNTRTDAGSQTVTVALEDKQNTQWEDGTTDDVTFPFAIAKAESSVTKAPEDAKSLYNGGNVQLITEGTAEGGTMQYSLDGENWSENIPTATDWKTYTVYYKVVGDSNHNDTKAQSLTAEIVPFKIQTQPQPVTIGYGNDAEMSVTLDPVLKEGISYQWYLVTVVEGKKGYTPLENETGSSLTLTKPNAGTYTYACEVTCGDYKETSAEAVVTVTAVKETLSPTADLPLGLWVEGGEEPLSGDSIDLKSPSSDFLTQYTEKEDTNEAKGYPTGMEVYKLVEKDGNLVPDRVEIFTNLLKYEGCSIRITGKPGIRMITSIDEKLKKELIRGGYGEFKLVAYGTVAQWTNTLNGKALTLSTGNPGYAYDADSGKDPIFGRSGGRVQYTNVLVWNELAVDKYNENIVMRPFIKLRKGTQELIIYGGTVSRSIGYVAKQNAKTFPEGSAGYKYVHDIIDKVTNLPGGNGE